MLDRIMEAAFDKFIETDSPELLQLCHEKTDRVLSKTDQIENKILDLFHDVGTAYETEAFKAGFKACIECFHSLMGLK